MERKLEESILKTSLISTKIEQRDIVIDRDSSVKQVNLDYSEASLQKSMRKVKTTKSEIKLDFVANSRRDSDQTSENLRIEYDQDEPKITNEEGRS